VSAVMGRPVQAARVTRARVLRHDGRALSARARLDGPEAACAYARVPRGAERPVDEALGRGTTDLLRDL
jgi:hypothetical protein